MKNLGEIMITSISSHIPAPSQIINNCVSNLSRISSIAIPVIALAAIPMANAGPIAAYCFVACESFLETLVLPAETCFAGCKIAIATPIP